jgi:hypothetical protein
LGSGLCTRIQHFKHPPHCSPPYGGTFVQMQLNTKWEMGGEKRGYQSIDNTRAKALVISCMFISESLPNC